MGHYTGIATRIKVKKEAPVEVIQFLDDIYELHVGDTKVRHLIDPNASINTEGGRYSVEEACQYVSRMLTYANAEFKTWAWRCKEDRTDHWLYESRASVKYDYPELFVALFDGIREHLILNDGDIVVRTIFEQACVEQVICVQGPRFVIENGVRYFDNLEDTRHPYSFDLDSREKERRASTQNWWIGRQEDDVELPWTISGVVDWNNKTP